MGSFKIQNNKILDQVEVKLGDRTYDIVIGNNLIEELEIYNLSSSEQIVIITDEVVSPLYLQKITNALGRLGFAFFSITIAAGETQKSLDNVGKIVGKLLSKKVSRDAMIIALGGGVVGDLAGFVASVYQRGIKFLQVPTTLLAQVDSSVGGKTAVNHSLGKNMIGAFHQPKKVIIDLATLGTLPSRELKSGYAEVIKYGCILDKDFFSWLENNVENLLNRSADHLAFAVKRSCEIKAEVVSLDEREGNSRALLNFGHTFGHAIESLAGYGVWLHGEAVGFGMILAAELSNQMGLIDKNSNERIRNIVAKFGLPVDWPNMDINQLVECMMVDKKFKNGNPKLILLKDLGVAKVISVNKNSIEKFLANHII